MIITIDGPVASGKSTLAKSLSKSINSFYLCSGLFYRAYAYILLELKINTLNENTVYLNLKKIDFEYKNDENFNPIVIYNSINITNFVNQEEVGLSASIISPYKELRDLINIKQRSYINLYENIITDGRDCGIKIFPEANFKFYITASLNARLNRILKRSNSENFDKINNFIQAIIERDKRDSERKISPTKPAFDSYIIDTSFMSIENVEKYTKGIINFYK